MVGTAGPYIAIHKSSKYGKLPFTCKFTSNINTSYVQNTYVYRLIIRLGYGTNCTNEYTILLEH